jgi:hypothetical protein
MNSEKGSEKYGLQMTGSSDEKTLKTGEREREREREKVIEGRSASVLTRRRVVSKWTKRPIKRKKEKQIERTKTTDFVSNFRLELRTKSERERDWFICFVFKDKSDGRKWMKKERKKV